MAFTVTDYSKAQGPIQMREARPNEKRMPLLIAAGCISLFVIGCMAAAGTFPRSTVTLSRVTVGLGAGLLSTHLIGVLRNKGRDTGDWLLLACSTIFLTGAIVGGALGMHNIANMQQVGWATIGPGIALTGLALLGGSAILGIGALGLLPSTDY